LTRSQLAQILCAAPGIALASLLLVGLALASVDQHPLWRFEPLNPSEAAALRDAGELGKLLQQGLDPNSAYPIRAGFLSGPVIMTPIEAAIAANRPEIVDMLIEAGAILEPDLNQVAP
jgi:hypothetical protein